MKIHPVVQHLNGTVTVLLQPSFVGDNTDTTDKQRIGAYGDPLVNLGGTFVDSAKPAIGTITMSGLPTANQTFIIGAQTFTWVVSGTALGNVVIGIDATACANNLVTSITRDISASVTAERVGTAVVVTSVVTGIAANTIIFTTTSTNMAVDGTGTLGGTQAGRAAQTFQTGAAEVYRGVTTQMPTTPVSFMTQIPLGSPGLSPTQAIVADPVVGAEIWKDIMISRISAAMAALRAKTPSQLVTLSDSTV